MRGAHVGALSGAGMEAPTHPHLPTPIAHGVVVVLGYLPTHPPLPSPLPAHTYACVVCTHG